ncbi:MAG: RNA methyltransferase, partial [Chloroflexota bacterium]
MITSTSNAKIKQVRALQSRAKNRREAGLFVIEGVRLAEEALQAGVKPKFVLFSDNLSERGRELLDKMDEYSSDIEEVAEYVLQSVSDSPSPQGILLVLPIVEPVLPEQLDLVIIVDQLRDPGNMGTILRSAAAAGVQAVLCTPDSVDLYSPKVLRGGMGSHFKLAVHSLAWDDIETICKNHSMEVYLAAADRGVAYTETVFSAATA